MTKYSCVFSYFSNTTTFISDQGLLSLPTPLLRPRSGKPSDSTGRSSRLSAGRARNHRSQELPRKEQEKQKMVDFAPPL